MRAFEAVGQRLSFTAGANALSVSQSAVSRHVIGLEELLGRPLFEREAGGLVLTPAGAELLPVVSKSFERIEQTLNAIRDDRVGHRTLRIHVPPSLLQLRLLPMLGEFRQAHHEFQIDISSSNVTGLPAEQIDMAIVYDRPNVDDWVTDLLLPARVVPMCSSATAERARGRSLGEFLADIELLHVRLDHQPRDLLWANYVQQQGLELTTRGGMAFDTAIAAAAYAETQPGVFLGEETIHAAQLQSGQLVTPFDAAADSGFGYYLKLHADDLADPAIAAFRSWLIARLGHGESPLAG
ncbi:MAG: LysR family transcriptional regulator [Proteobacteria bacterium]|nr:LysR family transcriptional regulator [Pseudomonadota bacterium]